MTTERTQSSRASQAARRARRPALTGPSQGSAALLQLLQTTTRAELGRKLGIGRRRVGAYASGQRRPGYLARQAFESVGIDALLWDLPIAAFVAPGCATLKGMQDGRRVSAVLPADTAARLERLRVNAAGAMASESATLAAVLARGLDVIESEQHHRRPRARRQGAHA